MAAALGKNVKLPNAKARCMFLINGVKNSSHHLKSNFHLCSPKQNRFLSSAAHKLVLSEDFSQRRGKIQEESPSSHGLYESIDAAFADVDTYLRRTGRVFRQSVDEVLCLIKDAGSVSGTQGLYLLRCCERMIDEVPSERVRLAKDIWEILRGYGVQFELSHYNSLLRLYVENGHNFSPGEFLSTMESQGLQPNKVTYRYLMEKCCDDGNLSAASDILGYLKKKDIPVDENIFNALIKGYINSGDLEGAENILEVMKSSNLSPNADSYTTLACGCAVRGDIDGMRAHLGALALTNKHLLRVIEALALSRQHKEIDQMLSKMEGIKDYRQDFINAAVALVHKDQVEVGYKLMLAASAPTFNTGTNIFLKQLVKNRKPIEMIIRYSDGVFKHGLNDIILLNLMKAAIDYEMMDYAIRLLQEMHKKGLPVRDTYFTSIFSYYERINSPEGVLSTLGHMCEMGVPPDFSTYRHRVLPALGLPNAQDFIAKLQENGLPTESAIDALFDYYCALGRSDLVLNLIESNTVCVSPNFDLRNYLAVCRKSDLNPMTYFKVLKFVLENIRSYTQDQEVVQGKLLAEFIRTDLNLFDAFKRKVECKLSSKSLQVCREVLKRDAPQHMVHLRRLEGEEKEMSSEEEARQLASLKDQGLSTNSFLLERLSYHMRMKNIDRVSELRAGLEEQGFEFSPGVCAQLISAYSEAKDIHAVESLMHTMKEKNPSFKLDIMKALDYASLLVKYEKYDQALESLKSALSDMDSPDNRGLLQRCLKRLFNTAAETGSVEFVRSLHELFLPHTDKIVHKDIILEPLVKVHAYRENLEGAWEEYRNAVVHHRVAPCLNLLLCKCIVTNDQDTLQKVVNVTTSHFGESLASVELAAALVETGRPVHALKVMETLGDKANEKHLEDIYTRLCTRSKSTALEQFLHITKPLTHINREKTYRFLLSLCAERNILDQGLHLWSLMEQEGVEPSQQTSLLVQDICRRSGSPPPANLQLGAPAPTESPSSSAAQYKQKFLQLLGEGDASRALDEINRMKKGYVRSITITELSQFVDLLLQNKSLMGLSSNVPAMSYLIQHVGQVVGPLLEKYSAGGSVEALGSLGALLPDFALKRLSFNYAYCRAFIHSGRHEELLAEMERKLGSKNKVFSTTAFQELLKVPALEQRCVDLAEKYMELNFDVPMCALWAHYFVNENFEKSENIQKQYAISFDKVDPTVLGTIRKSQNVSLGKRYMEVLNSHPSVRLRTKERAYGALLDVLVLKGEVDEACALVCEAEGRGLPLHRYYTSTLVTLKDALEREGKTVPFTLPTTQDMAASSV